MGCVAAALLAAAACTGLDDILAEIEDRPDGPSAQAPIGPVTPPWRATADDDDRIAFVTGRHGGRNPEIYVMDADGSSVERVTNDELWSVYPAWSPDHTQIAFDGSGEIYVAHAATGVRRITNDLYEDFWMAWAPDGSRIAFTRDVSGWFDFEIFVMDVDGSNARSLTPGLGGDKPTWSPDGSQIAFGSGDIYVMNADGSDLHAITDGPGWDQVPSWSPDGTRIAFARSTVDGREVDFDVWVVDVDGTNEVNLTRHPADDTEPTWSPDGSRIAFATDRDGNVEVYVMEADGSDPVNLTRHPGYDGQPAWWR